MNHAIASYIDFVQTLGFVAIVGLSAYVIKKTLLNFEPNIEKVNIDIEE